MLAVKATHLSKTYAGEGAPVTVFTDLSFELPEKLFAAVMGPSGIGKSTLLHLLGGIDSADAGRVEIFGQALEELPPRDVDVADVVVTFVERAAERAELDLDACGEFLVLVGALLELKAAIGGIIGRVLSRAENSNASRARAIAREPRLLLADEPTGNLDLDSAAMVFGLLEELHRERGMTTVLVTHNPDLASRCDILFSMSREGIVPAAGCSVGD